MYIGYVVIFLANIPEIEIVPENMFQNMSHVFWNYGHAFSLLRQIYCSIVFVFIQILTKNISQIINWVAFLQNIKSNKILFSGNKGNQHNNEKKLHFCQPKYIFKKQKYFSQIPVILNLFSLKTKVKLMVKNENIKLYSYHF